MKQLSIALVMVFALAACSGTANATRSDAASSAPVAAASSVPAAAATDACALVTRAEASTALGSKASAGIAKAGHDGYGSCRYYDATKTKNVFVQFVDPKLAAGMGSMGATDVPGIGDKAFWFGGAIFVSKGDKAAQVSLYLGAGSIKTIDPGEVDLAKIAATRM